MKLTTSLQLHPANPLILQILILLLSTVHLHAQNRSISYMTSGGKLKPLQAIMDIRHYTIALDVDIPQQSIQGYTTIDMILSQPTDTILLDLVHLLTVKKVTTNSSRSNFYQQGDSLFITNKSG